MTDYEAWNELCDLYLSQHDYGNAAFCLEELLMSNPHNHLFHQKYAEVSGKSVVFDVKSVVFYVRDDKFCQNSF